MINENITHCPICKSSERILKEQSYSFCPGLIDSNKSEPHIYISTNNSIHIYGDYQDANPRVYISNDGEVILFIDDEENPIFLEQIQIINDERVKYYMDLLNGSRIFQ